MRNQGKGHECVEGLTGEDVKATTRAANVYLPNAIVALFLAATKPSSSDQECGLTIKLTFARYAGLR